MEKYICYITDQYKIIENNKIEEGILINSSNDSVDPRDYHLLNCGENTFLKITIEKNRSFYKDDDQERNNEKVKVYNRKCVLYFENPSVYAFRQCGHQCICENCYAHLFEAVGGTQIVHERWDINLLRCAVCRT